METQVDFKACLKAVSPVDVMWEQVLETLFHVRHNILPVKATVL